VEKYDASKFVIVGVNSDKSLERLREVMAEQGLTWTSFFDGGGTGGPIATTWGVNGWPTNYVLDAEGVIRAVGVRGDAIDLVVDELLGIVREPEPEPAAEPPGEEPPKAPDTPR
jgi:hypothetical protein